MGLWDFLNAPENLIFSAHIGFVLLLCLMEILGTLLGFGFFEFIDDLLPDFDFDGDVSSPLNIFNAIEWLGVGRIPFIILIIVYFGLFGLIGLIIQRIIHNVTGSFLSPLWVISIASLTAVYVGHYCVWKIQKYLPKDETSALSEGDFIDRVAVIILGEAHKEKPAQAKLQDEFGQTHYFMVAPFDDNIILHQGDFVKLTALTDKGFYWCSKIEKE